MIAGLLVTFAGTALKYSTDPAATRNAGIGKLLISAVIGYFTLK